MKTINDTLAALPEGSGDDRSSRSVHAAWIKSLFSSEAMLYAVGLVYCWGEHLAFSTRLAPSEKTKFSTREITPRGSITPFRTIGGI